VRIDLEGDFLSRSALIEFLRPVGGDTTAVDYTRDLVGNHSRMVFSIRLPDERHEEPLMRRLEELPGLRRVEVERAE
jgi:hypothetical protein